MPEHHDLRSVCQSGRDRLPWCCLGLACTAYSKTRILLITQAVSCVDNAGGTQMDCTMHAVIYQYSWRRLSRLPGSLTALEAAVRLQQETLYQ